MDWRVLNYRRIFIPGRGRRRPGSGLQTSDRRDGGAERGFAGLRGGSRGQSTLAERADSRRLRWPLLLTAWDAVQSRRHQSTSLGFDSETVGGPATLERQYDRHAEGVVPAAAEQPGLPRADGQFATRRGAVGTTAQFGRDRRYGASPAKAGVDYTHRGLLRRESRWCRVAISTTRPRRRPCVACQTSPSSGGTCGRRAWANLRSSSRRRSASCEIVGMVRDNESSAAKRASDWYASPHQSHREDGDARHTSGAAESLVPRCAARSSPERDIPVPTS